ncbi:MAG: hypothetical protein EOP40_15110, partial [Rubrivivax sp.]
MSSLLQTLQALNSPRGMPGMSADSGLATQNKSGQEGQAFSSLMNQFRDGQTAAAAQPKSAAATPASANLASKDAASRAARATADRGAQNLAAQRQATAQREAAEPRPAEKAKAPVKTAQAPKPQQATKAKG